MKTTSLFIYVFLLDLFFLQGTFTCFSSVRSDSLGTIKIVGKVVDKKTGLPISGADVRVKGSLFGIKTFFDGSFQLMAQHGMPLYISYLNKDVEIVRVLRSQKFYNVELEDEVERIYKHVSQIPEFPGEKEVYNKFMEEHLKWDTLGYEELEGKYDRMDENRVYSIVEQMPEFPGGITECMRFISNNFNYENEEVYEQGRVVVQFVVEKDGSLTNLVLKRKAFPELDAEAIRVIGLMPPWVPGRHNGQTVAVRYTLPIIIRLE